jgi:hypothetical protein
MTYQRPDPPSPRPVLLGCVGAAAVVALLVLIVIFVVIFLESGADDGQLDLEQARAYAEGSVEFVGQRNIYLVRLEEDDFYALYDLDAANRANAQRRCRVAPIAPNDPLLPALLEQYRSNMSAQARGSNFLFRETCNNAVYDVTGLRLDNTTAPNLDRYRVTIRNNGRLSVDLTERICTTRTASDPFTPTACP